MKNALLFAFLSFCLFPVYAQTASTLPEKPYDIKSVRLVYKFVNGPQRGEKILVIDDWGRREKEVVTTITDTSYMTDMSSTAQAQQKDSFSRASDSMLASISKSIPSVQHQMLIHDSGQTYMVDLDRNIGYQRPYFQFTPNLDAIGQKEVGKDTILGKPCRVVEVQGAFRIWYWGKIALKKEIIQKVEGMNVGEYVVLIDVDYKIKPDEFKVPASVKMQ